MRFRAEILLLALAGAACDQALRIAPPDGGSPGPGVDAAREGAGEEPAQDCMPMPATASGSTPAGQACTEVASCRREEGELAFCQESTEQDVQQKLLRCHRLSRGKAGDECAATLGRGGRAQFTTSSALPFAAFSRYCALADGLECDFFQRACVPIPRQGESCAGRWICTVGSFCDRDVCVPALPLGARCSSIEDFIGRPQCVPSAQCELGRDTCVPALADGASCDDDAACSSGACVNGKCGEATACAR
jgi:hypothetical protein